MNGQGEMIPDRGKRPEKGAGVHGPALPFRHDHHDLYPISSRETMRRGGCRRSTIETNPPITYPSTSDANSNRRRFLCQSGMFNMRLNHSGSVRTWMKPPI